MVPKVTILMPTYNPRQEHLREAIQSVLDQTEQNWTLYIHDDASKKDVRAIVEQYLTDDRINFERGDENQGIGSNWNSCLRYIDAPYVQYLFQDDTWSPEYLRKAIAALEPDNIGFVTVGHEYIFEGNIPQQEHYEQLIKKKENLKAGAHNGKEFLLQWMERGLRPNFIGEPSFVMLKHDLMQKIGPFDEDMRQGLDIEYWTRCLLQSDFFYLDESLGAFRVHASGATAANEESGSGIFDRFLCFERLVRSLRGEEKRAAKKIFTRTFDDMVRRYVERRRSGKKVAGKGSGALKRFCLKHPLLLLRSLWRAKKS